MRRRHLSFTEKRRARLRFRLDQLELMESRNLVTEPINVLAAGLSVSMGMGLLDRLLFSGPIFAAGQGLAGRRLAIRQHIFARSFLEARQQLTWQHQNLNGARDQPVPCVVLGTLSSDGNEL